MLSVRLSRTSHSIDELDDDHRGDDDAGGEAVRQHEARRGGERVVTEFSTLSPE